MAPPRPGGRGDVGPQEKQPCKRWASIAIASLCLPETTGLSFLPNQEGYSAKGYLVKILSKKNHNQSPTCSLYPVQALRGTMGPECFLREAAAPPCEGRWSWMAQPCLTMSSPYQFLSRFSSQQSSGKMAQ